MISEFGDMFRIDSEGRGNDNRVQIFSHAGRHLLRQAKILHVNHGNIGVETFHKGEGSLVHRTCTAVIHKKEIVDIFLDHFKGAMEEVAGIESG